MNGIRAIHVFLLASLLMLAGCPKRQTDVPAKPVHELQEPPGERLEDLQHRVDQLRRTVSQMPGNSDAEDRKLTAQALGQISSCLALIEGPNSPGPVRQRLRIIES